MRITGLILLALLSLVSMLLVKGYRTWPVMELKRRAREDNATARALYKVVSLPHSIWAFLLPLEILSSAALVVALGYRQSWWLGFSVGLLLFWLATVWQTNQRPNRLAIRLAVWLAAPIAWINTQLHPLADWTYSLFRRFHPQHEHTGVYDKSELLHLIAVQQEQADSRLDSEELRLAAQALSFGEFTVQDIFTTRRHLVELSADQVLGPVVMDELHQSGQVVFLVYEGKKSNVVGTLSLTDVLQARQGESARALMRTPYYLHENDSLQTALQAAATTNQAAFVVVNDAAQVLGLVTARAVFEKLLGEQPVDAFDQFDDKTVVAGRSGQITENPPPEDPEPEMTSEAVTEVVE